MYKIMYQDMLYRTWGPYQAFASLHLGIKMPRVFTLWALPGFGGMWYYDI